MGNRCLAFSLRGIHEKECGNWVVRDGQGRYTAWAARGAMCFPKGEKEGRHFEGISILSRKRGASWEITSTWKRQEADVRLTCYRNIIKPFSQNRCDYHTI